MVAEENMDVLNRLQTNLIIPKYVVHYLFTRLKPPAVFHLCWTAGGEAVVLFQKKLPRKIRIKFNFFSIRPQANQTTFSNL